MKPLQTLSIKKITTPFFHLPQYPSLPNFNSNKSISKLAKIWFSQGDYSRIWAKWLQSPRRYQNTWLLKSFTQNGAISSHNLYTSSHVLKSFPGYLYLRQCKYYENSCWCTANSKFCFLELSENVKKFSILSWLILWVQKPWPTVLEFLTLQRLKFFQKFLLSGLLLLWAYVCWMIWPWMDGWRGRWVLG